MAKENVSETYQARRNDIAVLLDLICEEVKAHAATAEEDGLHWGHTGDLGALRQTLVQALAQISAQDEATIEEHLADMRD
jgi:hypothetical protein